jgi:hypothetical protein
MIAPVRLLDSTRNAAVRELLQAGVRERPRPSALHATALAVGVSLSVVTASTTATAAAGGATAAALVTPSLTLLAAKWLVLGTLGGLALAAGATFASELATSADESPSASAARGEAAATSVRQRPNAPQNTTALHSARAAAAVPRTEGSKDPIVALAVPSRPASVGKPSAQTATSAGRATPASASLPALQSLSREVAMIDGARRSLASADAAGALRQLDEYSAVMRTGTLDREAQLLRIDALTQSGQHAPALSLAERYLASYPNDPHAARLRALFAAP